MGLQLHQVFNFEGAVSPLHPPEACLLHGKLNLKAKEKTVCQQI
jgi:hypothetical protein